MKASTSSRMEPVLGFLRKGQPRPAGTLTAVSLFSGAGLSDAGYAAAGFRFVVQVELERDRAAIGRANFPGSAWLTGDATKLAEEVATAYRMSTKRRLDLLVATPPCQGMSSSNPGRGKRGTKSVKEHEAKNRLLLAVVPVAKSLRPRVIVAENVRQILTHTVTFRGKRVRLVDRLRSQLRSYELFEGVVNVADYGIPQDRRRSVLVGVRKSEPWLRLLKERKRVPWLAPTHAEGGRDGREAWISVREWLEAVGYPTLDSGSANAAKNGHPLHTVPHYDDCRYLWVSGIPPNSGRSAYENDVCPACGTVGVPVGRIRCPSCRGLMRNRPFVPCRGGGRLILGFDSSYRRMPPSLPSRTITTNSSHLGSDFKIHPWEHRVLSALECADLQTVPRWFDWSWALDQGKAYLVRNLVGEAFPPYFTYLHGRLLRRLLEVPTPPSPRLLARLCPSQLAAPSAARLKRLPRLNRRKSPSSRR